MKRKRNWPPPLSYIFKLILCCIFRDLLPERQTQTESEGNDAVASDAAAMILRSHSCRLRPWSDLPWEILELIVDHLRFGDFVRFGAVCKSWRLVTAHNPHRRALQLPWLAIVNDDVGCSLYTPIEAQGRGRAYRRHYPRPIIAGSLCLGSSNASCLFLSHPRLGVRLLNPFTRQYIQLPCTATHMCRPTWTPEFPWNGFSTFTLSSDPSPDNLAARKCIVVAVQYSSTVAFCCPGDPQWTILPRGIKEFGDVIFFKGLLYCVNPDHHLVVIEFGSSPQPSFSLTFIELYDYPLPPSAEGERMYLVDLAGELALLCKYVNRAEEDIELVRAIGFAVYRLDTCAVPTRWVDVESLGDKMLLLSYNCLWAVDARDFSAAGFRANCIYFTDEEELDKNEWREFCLEDNKFRRFSPSASFSIRTPLLWVKPNIV